MLLIFQRNSVIAVTLLCSWLALACAAAPRPSPQHDSRPLGERAAALLSESIRIRTVSPPGNEKPLAQLLVNRMRESGLEAELIETPRGSAPLGRAAAWGVLRGSGRGKPIVLLSHLDVVPAERAEWGTDPFAGEVSQGYVTGRGALDAKGVAIVHLLHAHRARAPRRQALARRDPARDPGRGDGRRGRRRLGGARAPRSAARRRLPAHRGRRHRRERRARLGLGHRRVGEVTVLAARHRARRPGTWLGARPQCRGAAPDRRARPHSAARDAGARRARRWRRCFAAMAHRAPPGDGPAYANLAAALASDDAFRERFLAQPANAALVRNTVAITVLQGSEATNMIPAVASAEHRRAAAARRDVRRLPRADRTHARGPGPERRDPAQPSTRRPRSPTRRCIERSRRWRRRRIPGRWSCRA